MVDDRWRSLEVWKMADDLAVEVYAITRSFPREELYGVVSQLRRAALSVPTNIVEGYSRKGDRELSRFVTIGLGSLAETKYLLHFAARLGYLTESEYESIRSQYETLGQRLWRFYESVGGGHE